MLNLTTLESILLNATNEEINACEKMYSANFRSEAFPLKDLEYWEDFKKDLLIDLAVFVYQIETKVIQPTPPHDGFDCEHEGNCFYNSIENYQDDALEYLQKTYPLMIIDGNTEVITPCNYKGEGENPELYILNKSLPVFRSKADSFYQANS